MRRLPASLSLAIVMLLLAPAWARAHAIGLDCTLRGDKVEVEAYYDDGSNAARAKIEVASADGKIVAQGTTDARGQWVFATPAAGKYEVRVDAGAGHRAKRAITIPAATGAPGTTEPAKAVPAPAGAIPPVLTAEPTVVPISDGPTRDDFTRTPWLKIAIGLAVIGSCCGAFLLASLLRRGNAPKQA